MSGERVILRVKWDAPAGARELRRAVGGFLRYVQYRDKHPDSEPEPAADPKVNGLLNYVAYRDGAAVKGRLFGAEGLVGDAERRELATFVARSIAATRPQLQTVDGELVDRRRAVYRFVLSPESAAGLDLQALTRSAVDRLQREAGVTGLRWLAAEHRNTEHPHVHLVLAGMRETSIGVYRGFILTPPRLAAMKDELALEIARQRTAERKPETGPGAVAAVVRDIRRTPSGRRVVGPPELTPRSVRRPARSDRSLVGPRHTPVFMRLQVAALRYRRQLEREDELERNRRLREVER